MSDPTPRAKDLYKSSQRRAEIEAMPFAQRLLHQDQGDGRDGLGRFVARYSGKVCDRIGCEDRIEARGRRFCATHRADHGARLGAQLKAIVDASGGGLGV